MRAVKKWLWCSWRHRGMRCYPHVWHECNYWHCVRCHPCGEGLMKFDIDAVETITFDEMWNSPRFNE